MKYGFSLNMIKHYCEGIGIKYFSVPELGVVSVYRKNLESKDDYKKLFRFYKQKVLPKNIEKIETLAELLKRNKRIALMCFEKDHEMCHRSMTGRFLSDYCNSKYELFHI